MLFTDKVKNDKIPVIKRYSGGGTVICDKDTFFISFILNKIVLPPKLRWPTTLIEYYGNFYKEIFDELSKKYPLLPEFNLKENDYILGDKKFGGNAMCFSKTRMVHHTSFLFNYSKENMKYLQNPLKQPQYRSNRDHTDFLVPLNKYLPSSDVLKESVIVLY